MIDLKTDLVLIFHGKGLNLVGQIVKSLGGTVQVRSNQGRGTTVKVSLPLRQLASSTSSNSREASRDRSRPQASVGFFGFGDCEATSTTGPSKAKAIRQLHDSMKRYCTQLGMPVQSIDDNMNSNASIHIVSEQALKSFLQAKDRGLRSTLLSSNSLRKPMLVICASRESASQLRSGPLGASLPDATQYLWLPIGPAKLASALSICRMYLLEGNFHRHCICDRAELTRSQRKGLLRKSPAQLSRLPNCRKVPNLPRQQQQKKIDKDMKKEMRAKRMPQKNLYRQTTCPTHKTKARSSETSRTRQPTTPGIAKSAHRRNGIKPERAAVRQWKKPSTHLYRYGRR